jgi:GEVED domain
VSGNNGGYRDYTSVQLNMVSGTPGTNIVLTPGFGGNAFSERWAVWVDLNRDSVFSSNELLVSGTSLSPLSAMLTIPAGTVAGATRMRVALSFGTTPPACGSFSYGEVEDYTVNVQSPANPPPPPPGGPAYCASRGTSSFEYIQQIFANGTTRTSGNNLGYGDFTTASPIPLLRGANSVALTPGFQSTAYSEQWMVWIDFNKDGVFGNEDWVFGGTGASTVNGNVNVPTTASAGITRMRVQMKFGSAATSCETFAYGEVEDYAVQIP